MNWAAASTERGYDVFIDWTGAGPNGTDTWESEPNNGGGQFNVFPGSVERLEDMPGVYQILMNTK